jgi:flavin-dependent dehydrogenase
MIDTNVIIVGGGPAGSSCAWKLKEHGLESLILDKSIFPRAKLCAGWITSKVVKNLKMSLSTYPFSITVFRKLFIHIGKRKFIIPTTQYAIRRIEFDHWLLRRCGAKVEQHEVKNVIKKDNFFIIDDEFRCRYLVGAGGTNCPVYRNFFKKKFPREIDKLIVTIEAEIPYNYRDGHCYLWFYDNNIPGYSWYVPKKDGYLSIGIGGKFVALKNRGESIKDYWKIFIEKLKNLSLVSDIKIPPRGYSYFLRQQNIPAFDQNLFIVGDAVGLATLDMGEGIRPAVESGIAVAKSIITNSPLSLKNIPKYSYFKILFPWR